MNKHRAFENWRKLIQAVETKYETPEQEDQTTSGLYLSQGASSKAAHIEDILQLANEIENERPDIAFYLSEHANTLVEELDPVEGRAILQFKTGLMSHMKKGRRDLWDITHDPKSRFYKLIAFYGTYKNKKLDEVSHADKGDSKYKKYADLQILREVIDEFEEKYGFEKPMQFKYSVEEDEKWMGGLQNILPLYLRHNPQGDDDPQGYTVSEEVTAAIESLRASWLPGNWTDLFDFLYKEFGFQIGNVHNQWEHLVLLLADVYARVPTSDEQRKEACITLCETVLENYKSWCTYLRIKPAYEKDNLDYMEDPDYKQKILLLCTALYLLIWGEAANVRFLPECLCFIFHKMSQELLEAILKRGNNETRSCIVNFLEDVIVPVYNCLYLNISMQSKKKSYSKWCNYDDVNEYFWSSACFQLEWPFKKVNLQSEMDSRGDIKEKQFHTKYEDSGSSLNKIGKSSFIEHRTYLHLYHSFHRLWIFLILMFQGLTIFAFSQQLHSNKIKPLMSLGSVYFVLMFVKAILDIVMMVGACKNAQFFPMTRILLRFLFFGAVAGFITYLYLLILKGEVYIFGILVMDLYLGICCTYILIALFVSIMLKISTLRTWAHSCDNWGLVRLIQWMHQEYYYVGRKLYEETVDYLTYTIFWIVVLFCKFLFCYFLQIKPLIQPTITIAGRNDVVYTWYSVTSEGHYNVHAILALWAPVVMIYLLDIQIWYTLFASILGGLIGAWQRIGEIHSNETLLHRFKGLHGLQGPPFENMVPRDLNSRSNTTFISDEDVKEEVFVLFWNEVINCLRKEDYIDDKEEKSLRLQNKMKKDSERDTEHEHNQKGNKMSAKDKDGDKANQLPRSSEACRRLHFFANSLFMDMPHPPRVRHMRSFSVLTPYTLDDKAIYTIDELTKPNEDGISILFYLQKIFPDEWKNFLSRTKINIERLDKLNMNPEDAMNLRLWASYRGQTLARTVRGMMYYHKALELQSLSETLFTEDLTVKNGVKEQATRKFTHVVACRTYDQNKNDMLYLLQRNEALRLAVVQTVDEIKSDKIHKEYFSRLVKSDVNGKEREIYKIRLPGDPMLGESKSEIQNHAIIFTRGEALQTIDVDQDNYFEEALKMRNLLEEFNVKPHVPHTPSILGVREHVFTGSVSSIASFMSHQEESFVTIGQRVLANPLKVRMHYGHGSVFNRIFHITRGGVSKASKGINVTEDVYGGYNSILRNGNITHHEYIQVGKGCPVGLNQISMFEGRIAAGNGEQTLSRDVYRLGQLFDFFRMSSFYVTHVGFYFCTMMSVLTVYLFLYGKAYLALSGIARFLEASTISTQNTSSSAAMEFIFQIGIIATVPILAELLLARGPFKAIITIMTMQIQLYSVFYSFILGTRTHYFGRSILHGISKYRNTGKGFVVQHIKFSENYRLYSRSHFVKGLEIILLLIVCLVYGSGDTSSTYKLVEFICWFLAFSWLSAPFLFNPAGFEWQKIVEDFADWTNWIMHKRGVGLLAEDSWETWWLSEQEHINTPRGRILETLLSLRFLFFQYGVVYKLHVVKGSTSPLIYGYSWLVLLGIILLSLIFTVSQKSSVNIQIILRFLQGTVSFLVLFTLILLVTLGIVTVGDLFALLLAFIPTGWAIISVAIAWKPLMKNLKVWTYISTLAKFYDGAMGMLLFMPIALLSWLPFVSTFQTRLLYNQAFSRGLEISLILAGNQPRDDATSTEPSSGVLSASSSKKAR